MNNYQITNTKTKETEFVEADYFVFKSESKMLLFFAYTDDDGDYNDKPRQELVASYDANDYNAKKIININNR